MPRDRFGELQDEDPLPDVPEVLISAFSRCKNYPTDRAGIIALVRGLEKASKAHEVVVQAIVERCLLKSPFCPTDCDLMKAALDIREERERRVAAAEDKRAEWQKKYGAPEPVRYVMSRDSEGRERWRELWRKLKLKYPQKWPDWMTLAREARRLGYEEYARSWENSGVR